ncbi:MAG: riboflavin biosynthesis protein RibF [Erysipelotrichales bacterium]|nr:riboflavin biosynthesis protein RibF [Erysipelotrichales bacterium]
MEVIKIHLEDEMQDFPACSACIGYFDGVHRGHQELIRKTVEASVSKSLIPACITFDPDPWVVLKGIKDVPHLTSVLQRAEWMNHYGIQRLYLVEFTQKLADLSPEDFIQKILLPLHVKHLVCGFDYTFGKFGAGKADDLRKVSVFNTEIVDAVIHEEEKISSTRIEKLIIEGELETANRLLGHPYVMEGKVIHGREKGRTIGFPTANLSPCDSYVIPKTAVYAGECEIEGKVYRAMINFGHNSAFNRYKNISFEVHLIGYEGNLYGRSIRVSVLKKVRDEMKFNGLNELKRQLTEDRETILTYDFGNIFNL